MDVGAKLEEIGQEVSSPYVIYLASLKDDLRWLRLFELPDTILGKLCKRLTSSSRNSEAITDAISEVLLARKEFRKSVQEQSLSEALQRNQIRTQLEEELGHSLSKQSAYSWAAGQGSLKQMSKLFEGFFIDVRSRISKGNFDPQPVLACAIDADRII